MFIDINNYFIKNNELNTIDEYKIRTINLKYHLLLKDFL